MITYEEFEKEIKRIAKTYDLDLEISFGDNCVLVCLEDVSCVNISKNKRYLLDTVADAFSSLEDSPKYELFVVCCELAQTPIPKREQKKKFYLKHRYLNGDVNQFLNRTLTDNRLDLSTAKDYAEFQTKFTQSEIDEIKKKYNTDLKDFEIIEVKE